MRLQKEQMDGRLPFVAAMQSSAISSKGAFEAESAQGPPRRQTRETQGSAMRRKLNFSMEPMRTHRVH